MPLRLQPKHKRRARLDGASTGWLATCLCIALVFGWRAAGHSGSLAQPVHAASPSTPAVPSAGSLPLVPIESVTTAHEVLAFDPATGRTAWKPVLQSIRRTTDHLRHLTVLSPSGTTQTFETTDEHPFWSVDAGEWVAAGSLQVGDRFQATDGSLHVLTATRYEPHPAGMPVFNFEVEDYHSYFVSVHGSRGPPLLVHNADCDDPHLFRDSAGRLRNVDGTFAYDGGSQSGRLHRPSLRADTRAAIEASALKNADGQFLDPQSSVLGEWHYGHIRGHENRRILAAADLLGVSQSQLNDYVNARPQFFQIEDAARNLRHAGELQGTNQLGSILRDMRNFFGFSR